MGDLLIDSRSVTATGAPGPGCRLDPGTGCGSRQRGVGDGQGPVPYDVGDLGDAEYGAQLPRRQVPNRPGGAFPRSSLREGGRAGGVERDLPLDLVQDLVD